MDKNSLLGSMTAALLLATLPLYASIDDLLPTPKEVTSYWCMADCPEQFRFQEGVAPRLVDAFSLLTGQQPSFTEGLLVTIETGADIEGAYDYPLSGYENEAYELNVQTDGISIRAATETGVVRAFATLAQLCDTTVIQCCTIRDWPSFKLRGYMHDVGRSFISFAELKKELLLLARFKVNTFHWHLTENQAWRFEVKQYPQLTSAETMTRFAGQYYTQEQCHELDSLAWILGMNIIPEIDMPGHSEAFNRAMGHSMQTAKGVEELQNILGEAAATFAHAPYIHIGADEVQITYPNFLKTISRRVHELGKQVVAWNPIQGKTITRDSGIDMTQMWSAAGKKVTGMPNIDCRYNYVNHFDIFADLAGIYRSNIYYEQQGNADVAGTVTAVWNDTYILSEEAIIRQNNFYANTLASAERAWKGGGRQYIEQGGAVLPVEGSELNEFRSWETRFLHYKATWLADEPIGYVRQTDIVWQVTDAFPNGGHADTCFPPETEGPQDNYTYEGQTYQTRPARGGTVYLRHVWGTLVPCFYADPQLNQTAYAWTWVYSPCEQDAGALVELQNYSRSEHDAVPENGQWDKRGSRLWLNDVELPGPEWDNAGVSIGKESPLLNENCTERPPVSVHLQAGWNKVFLKLPYVATPGIRLNKWMFTFVLTDPEGRNALDGIVYSATPTPAQGIAEPTVDTPVEAGAPEAYDLSGRRAAAQLRQGLYIIKGGKKVL